MWRDQTLEVGRHEYGDIGTDPPLRLPLYDRGATAAKLSLSPLFIDRVIRMG